MKRSKRILCAMLSLFVCLACCFSGCAGKNDLPTTSDSAATPDSSSDGASSSDSQSAPETPPQTLWQVIDGGLAAYIDDPYLLGMTESTLWAVGQADAEGDGRRDLFVRMDMDTLETVCLPLQLPQPALQAAEGQSVLQTISEAFFSPAQELLLLLEERLIDHAQDSSDEYYASMQHPLESQLTVCAVNETGEVQPTGTVQLPQPLQPQDGVQVGTLWHGSFLGADGDLRLAMFCGKELPGGGVSTADTFLLRVSPDGSCQSCTPLSTGSLDYGAPLRRADDSAVYLQEDVSANETRWLIVEGLSTDAPTVTAQPAPEELRMAAYQAVESADRQLSLWWGLDGVRLLDEELATTQSVLRWSDYGLADATLYGVYDRGQNELLVAATTRQDGFALYRLKLAEDSPLAGQRVLTLAIQSDFFGTLQAAVDAYNYSGPDVYIQTVDYSNQAAQQAGFATGAEMLVDDILHNTAPDILQLSSNMGTQQWIRQGLFVDLYPYLDADPALDRQDLIGNALAACEHNGTLPTLMPSFVFSTVMIANDLWQTPAAHWNLQQFTEVCDTLPQLQMPFYPQGRAYALQLFVASGGSTFIDYATGTCHLDDPAFVHLLEQSAAWSEEGADDIQQDPKAAFVGGQAAAYATDLSVFRQLKAMRYIFDGDFSFIGMPTDSGTGNGSTLRPDLWLGVTRYCHDPDAAWQFLRTFLLPEFQDNLSLALPLRRDALRAQADAAAAPIDRMEELGYYPPYLQNMQLTKQQQQDYWLQGCQTGDIDALLAAIEDASTLYLYDYTVTDILAEEAEAFYNGQRSAEDAAKIIQDRVQTYLDEQS